MWKPGSEINLPSFHSAGVCECVYAHTSTSLKPRCNYSVPSYAELKHLLTCFIHFLYLLIMFPERPVQSTTAPLVLRNLILSTWQQLRWLPTLASGGISRASLRVFWNVWCDPQVAHRCLAVDHFKMTSKMGVWHGCCSVWVDQRL